MRVSIRNFQAFEDVTLNVEGVTTIVGPSNIGKSALVRAITAALFSRPGDNFVRKGAKSSVVLLEDVPGVDGYIEWEKGKGVNRFNIGDVIYDKVAMDVPLAIRNAGYRDIKIRDSYIRPQVAEQFDRLFLLDRPGSFISDVLLEAHRISTLKKAGQSCSGDLRQNKVLRNVRVKDLKTAQGQLDAVVDVESFISRVRTLESESKKLREAHERVKRVKELRTRLSAIKESTTIKLPAHTEFDSSTYETVARLQDLLRRRKLLLSLPTLPCIDVSAGMDVIEKHIQQASVLSIAKERHKRSFQAWQDSRIAVHSIRELEEEAVAEFDLMKAEVKVCPVCEKPL